MYAMQKFNRDGGGQALMPHQVAMGTKSQILAIPKSAFHAVCFLSALSPSYTIISEPFLAAITLVPAFLHSTVQCSKHNS